MARFKVQVSRVSRVIERVEVEVEAIDATEAENIVDAMSEDGDDALGKWVVAEVETQNYAYCVRRAEPNAEEARS